MRKSRGYQVEERWFCGAECAQDFLLERISGLLSGCCSGPPEAVHVPMGTLLAKQGAIDEWQLRQTLCMQKDAAPRRLGEHLLALGIVTELQIAKALGQQWDCPFYPLERQPMESLPFSLAPLEVFLASGSIPVYLSPDMRSLHIAFCDHIDYTTLFALESMLACRAYPCVATASAIRNALGSRAASLFRQDCSFETVRGAREMMARLASHAEESQATRVKLVRTERHLWGRLRKKQSIRDVLFELPPAAATCTALRSPEAGKRATSPSQQSEVKTPEPVHARIH